MPSRIPETFAYPVVYPNGAVVYCDTEEEANTLRQTIIDMYKSLEVEIDE